jgi:hypothetical protein
VNNMHADASISIFLAALQGICANPVFFGPTFQGLPSAAVEFAQSCVRASYRDDPERAYPDWSGVDASGKLISKKESP